MKKKLPAATKKTTAIIPASDHPSLASPVVPAGYEELLQELKTRIRHAQIRAALAVNRELVLLYWQIGRDILQRQQGQGWGAKVIDRLSNDLRRAFPEMKGFSPRNLKYMRAFAEAWPDEQFVQQLAAQIPWFHNCILLDKLRDADEREWYVRKTIEHGWSRNILVLQIETRLFHRQGKAVSNFARGKLHACRQSARRRRGTITPISAISHRCSLEGVGSRLSIGFDLPGHVLFARVLRAAGDFRNRAAFGQGSQSGARGARRKL